MSLHFVNLVDDDETVSLGSKDSTTSTGSKLSRDSGFSAKRISLTTELQNLRKQMNKRMRRESDERVTQMEALGRCLEALGRCLEEERVVHVLKHGEQDDSIADLESFQNQLGLEQKAHGELIDSNTLTIEKLAAGMDSLSRKGEVCDNKLMVLAQQLKETSAECNAKFEESHTRRAEDLKICQNSNERCSQLEKLMQRFETQIAETNAKLSELESEHALDMDIIEGQHDHIVELESQKQLDQKAQSEQIESEHASRTREIEALRTQIDILIRDDEVRNYDLRELTKRFEQTSAELNVRFEKLTQRLETKIMEHKPKFIQNSTLDHTGAVPVNFETFHDQVKWQLASDKTYKELIEAGVKSRTRGLQDLSAMFDARVENLPTRLDTGYADREEKQEEQNQAEISRRTLETTLAEEVSSQKKHVQAESILRMQIAQSSDRESTERHMQLQDLESHVKADIETIFKTPLKAVVGDCVKIGVHFVCCYFLWQRSFP